VRFYRHSPRRRGALGCSLKSPPSYAPESRESVGNAKGGCEQGGDLLDFKVWMQLRNRAGERGTLSRATEQDNGGVGEVDF